MLWYTPATVVQTMERHLVLRARETPSTRTVADVPAVIARCEAQQKICEFMIGKPANISCTLCRIWRVDVVGEHPHSPGRIAPDMAKKRERIAG